MNPQDQETQGVPTGIVRPSMDFADLVKVRKSIRRYSEKDVEQEKLDKIMEAARLAPSWANKQCWNYVVVRDKAVLEQITSKGVGMLLTWLKKAPVIIVACANPKDSGRRNGIEYYLVDIGISMEQLVLQAADLGLGTCWIGWFDEKEMKRILGVPEEYKVVALTPVGYPAEDGGILARVRKSFVGGSTRKSMEEIVHKDKW